MMYAIVNNERAEATPGVRGVCPACQGETIARCGQIKVWHWAHKQSDDDCCGCEPETEWHRAWKNAVPVAWRERIVRAGGRLRRADVLKLTSTPIVYEFQNSPISTEDIEARERFYLKTAQCGMVWVFNVQDGLHWQGDSEKSGNKRFHIMPPSPCPGDEVGFHWENGRISILWTKTRVYLDIGRIYIGGLSGAVHFFREEDYADCLLMVRNFSKSGKFSGKAQLITRQMFIENELLFHLPPLTPPWNKVSPVYNDLTPIGDVAQ